jgi:phage shock protein C
MADRTEHAVVRRSRDDRVLAGVLGGLAEKWGVPATRLRVAFVILSVLSAGFPGFLLYLLLWYVLPEAEGDGSRRG